MSLNPEVLKSYAAIIGSVVALFTALAPLTIRTGKSRLRADIEILNMLQKNPDYGNDDAYKMLKKAIDDRILDIYSPLKISSLTRIVFILLGVLLIGLFGYYTFEYASIFSLWSIFTAYLTVVGIFYLLAGIKGRGKLFEILKLIPKAVKQDDEHGQNI